MEDARSQEGMPRGETATTGRPLVSVIVPVFNEEAVLHDLQARLDSALATVEGGYEVVYVNDGSSDGSAARIAAWVHERADVTLVQLSRNFGMEIAMSAGLDHARGAYIALLHADLQDPPEMIPEMLARACAGADVVFARRIGRDESFLKRNLATGFHKLMERISRTPYHGQAGDFRVMSRRVVDTIRTMPERRRFLRGMIAWVGYEQVPIEYRRADRQAGRGASYPALFRIAFEALLSFSDVPLSLASYLGMLVSVASAITGVTLLVLTSLGVISTSIATWTLIVLLFLGGVQLVSTGILGRYVARVHTQALGRPLYLVKDVKPAERIVPEEPGNSTSIQIYRRSAPSSPLPGEGAADESATT